MPLINGQKMACEPCIRGHRSTKCTHANERLMVPVRKPGRPLSTCPHPPARGCGCGSVTAAIPRKQRCGCGSSTATPTESSAASSIVKAESPASDAPPMSPTKGPAASFRVQKPAAKAASRKQSFDPANLERMDAAHVNILPPFDMAGPNGIPQTSAVMGMPTPRPSMDYGAMPMMGAVNGGFHQPMMYPMFPQQMPGTIFSPAAAPMAMPQTNGVVPTPDASKTAQSSAPTKATNGGGSCCSGSTNGAAKPSVAPTPTPASTGSSCCSGPGKSDGSTTEPSSVTSSPKAVSKPKTGGGCCASKAPPINTNVVSNGHMVNGHMSPNGMAMSPFQTPIAMPQGMYQSYFQPTIFTYPPQYGSYMSPLQPAQWRQAMESLQYGQPAPHPTGFNMPTPLGFTPEGANPAVPESTSHMCSCGDGCQCIGCAAHPYNDATQDYVRSAWKSMMDDSYGATNGANGTNGTNGHMEAATTNGTGARGVDPHTNGDSSGSPPAPQTPSDAASGLSEEQALSASDFFFVTYPFDGDACAGETSSCPCGDDCQCLGCSIHNNAPLPES
ncbi:Protein GRISEA [Colletotrichum musicola]|uniref:Protein GRISEA n=1 Tax=Colletotrichum musicola TaxID=2175873 RepID=A0A8H6KV44_9PEZI|nr:Protein GRISEA [Colletotrichum musicola]